MRLINADAMRNAIHDFFKGCLDDYGHTIDTVDTSALVSGLVDMVESAYPVDAEPIRHGHWIQRWTGNEYIVFCSNCRTEANEIVDYELEYNFCPHCGAKMDEEKTE